MRPCTLLLLLPAALCAGQARFARLGDFEGKVEVQMQAADPWMPAERNLPLVEGAWLRTAASSRVEIELDEGSALRLGPDSQAEISDYSRLSTGQLITLVSLDHGSAYFTGEPRGKDSLSLVIPGGQLILTGGARVRLSAQGNWSEMSVIEGSVKVSSPQLEVTLAEGQTIRFDPGSATPFGFSRQMDPMDLDAWSEARDKALFAPASAGHVSQRAGVADLDRSGEWVQTTDLGSVWKPRTPAAWTPYQNGRWRWYDSIGYTWVSDDAWGWLPYHFGRWTRRDALGWVWAPGKSQVFKPGEVYWLRGAKLAGWGPLAPGEVWAPSSAPLQFLAANTTYAAWVQDARLIDPTGFTDRPKEPLGVAAFALALPSPALAASRLDATRPVLRAGSTAVTPVAPGVTYDASAPPLPDPPPPERPPAVLTNPDSASAPDVVTDSPDAVPPDAAAPPVVLYPAPVYTGIIVINPPENPDYVRRRGTRNPPPAAPPGKTPAPPPTTPSSTQPAIARGPAADASHRAPAIVPAPTPVAAPAPAPAPPQAPASPTVPRSQPTQPVQARPEPLPQRAPEPVRAAPSAPTPAPAPAVTAPAPAPAPAAAPAAPTPAATPSAPVPRVDPPAGRRSQ